MARLSRYWLYEAFENNTAYSNLNLQAAAMKVQNELYKRIRGIYNPVARQNQLLTSYIYGGSIDYEHMTGGAVPIVTDNEALIDALRQVMIWTRWGETKSLYVQWGALLGDVILKVIDDREKQKVRMEVVHPSRIREAEFDAVGNVTSAVIEYMKYDAPKVENFRPTSGGGIDTRNSTQWYTYTEIITKDSFKTFKNGKPFAYFSDASGKLVDSWDNEYGFVPLVVAGHAASGLTWNKNSFYNCIGKINAINDLASQLNDNARVVMAPVLYGAGLSAQKKIDVAAEERDQYRIIYGPENTSLTPIVAPIDQTGALQNIASMLEELERDLPELALQNIRNGSHLTGPGIRAAYSDAIGRITEARGRYDQAQVRALQMAVSIGGYNGYESFKGFSLDSYDAGDLQFYIKDRPVIADELGKSDKLTALGTIATMPPALQRVALQEMEYDDQTINDVVNAAEQQQAKAQQQAAQIAGQGQQPQLDANGKPVIAGGKASELPNGKPANANHPAANGQALGQLAATWQKLGISPALIGAKTA
jgi:hypothetical protein